MSLQPLGNVTPQPQSGDAGAGPKSFHDRKREQLQAEREPLPVTPESEAESAEDDELEDLEAVAGDAEMVEDEALEAESTESDDIEAAAEDDAEDVDWKDKFDSLQKEFSRVTANRKKIEQDFSDSIADNTRLRFELEDVVEQSKAQGQFWLNMANQQASYYENLDWSQVSPEQMGEVKNAAQRAQLQRNQIIQHFEQIAQQQHHALEKAKQREAEVGRQWLSRTIPGWGNELYQKLGEHARTLGYNAQDYGEITDPRIIKLIYDNYEKQQAVEKVKGIKRKQKANVPTANGRRASRTAQGKARQAREQARARPGDRAAMRSAFEARLLAENKGR